MGCSQQARTRRAVTELTARALASTPALAYRSEMDVRAAPWMVISLAAHALLALAPRVPAVRPPPAPEALEVAVHVESVDRAPAPAAPDVAPEQLAPRTPRRASRAHRERVPALAPAPPRTSVPPPAPAAKPAIPTLALDPRAVARAAPPEDGALDAFEADAGPAPSARAKLERTIMAGVRSHVDTIPDPVLRRGPKGGYVYEGHGFDAIIRPDGSVDLRDRFSSVHIPLVPYQTPTGEWRIGLLGGSLKLFEWLDRKFKNDPYRSERRWFLERTRTLRETLERDHYGKAAAGETGLEAGGADAASGARSRDRHR